ncbi:hypothetical protein Q2T40_17415 [Winogradskyella maritima]|uniref:Beta-carotene 15,15'-monooxygenase n=1 Tax=Winogradskyella maritima TaxID=1517766 RepID=A0ABV8AFN3_9FLAO|nr:hypothetical protein [Winogradskyella maritima]
MELLELKSVWTKVVDNDQTLYTVAEQDIKEIISNKSNALFSKIIRELKPKRWFMGVIGVLTLLSSSVYLFSDDNNHIFDDIFSKEEMGFFAFTLGIVILILFVNIVRSYNQFKAFEESAPNLKMALYDSISLLRRIQKLAIFSDSVTAPIVIGWYTYRKFFKEDVFFWDKRVFYIILSIVISLVLFYLFSRAMQHRKFGKYIEQATQNLSDLEALEKK